MEHDSAVLIPGLRCAIAVMTDSPDKPGSVVDLGHIAMSDAHAGKHPVVETVLLVSLLSARTVDGDDVVVAVVNNGRVC